MPFIRKHIPSPTVAISTPAMDGPSRRVPLIRDEFKAMALPRSSLFSTISTTKDWREGISKAFIMPSKKLMAITCQTSTVPFKTMIARINA